ncbi:hypothetical protein [Sphingobacterium multivorum]|nr:hypothetical protein [Sphingobacterium multivorum]
MKKNTQDYNGPYFSGFIKTRLSPIYMTLGDQNRDVIQNTAIGEK